MSDPTAREAGRVANSIALLQFAWGHPEVVRLLERVGLSAAMAYFPIRVAPMGPIPPMVAQSLMPFFPVPLVAKMVDRSRAVISADDLWDQVSVTLEAASTQVYGAFESLDELTDLLGSAAAACDLDGRVLTAAWASVDWSAPAARLFGAATVLREHRGEGHWFALAAAGVSGEEAHVLSQLGNGRPRYKMSHGFRPEQADEVIARLEARGWIREDTVTDEGEAFRAGIEDSTDALDAAPWNAIGDTGIARVVELGRSLPGLTG